MGGSGVVASELGLALAKRGHSVHIISYELPFRLRQFHKNIAFHSVDTVTYPLFRYPPYVISLTNQIYYVAREESLDILHMHYAVPHALCAYLARKMLIGESREGITKGPAIITTTHGTDVTLVGSERSYFPITKFALEESDTVTAVSHYLKDRTREIFELQKEIEVIYNFVDTSRFNRAADNELHREEFAQKGERLLVHTSNFRPIKRAEDVVRLFHMIQKEVPARLIMIGEGVDKPKAHNLAEELKIIDKVRFLGVQEVLEPYLALCDLFILTSEEESFGLSTLEAMSSGVPVIGTDTGGTPEVVEDGKSGFLSSPGDLNKMAGDAIRLLEDDDLLKRFRDNARRRALEKFDVELVAPEYEALYYRLSEGRV